MDFSRTFLERKSVRAYEERPLPADVKAKVLEAVLRAPTAGNMMLYSILEIDDQALKDKLAETCDHQPFIAKAPWVLVFLADYARMMAFFEASGVGERCRREGKALVKPRESDLLLASCDALIAAQTAVCAAESLGLGSCYIGDVMENWETHRDLLALPRYTFPIAMLCLGYPTAQQAARVQPARLPAPIIIQKDRYALPSAEVLASLYAGEGYNAFTPTAAAENPGQALYARKFSADFSLEMRRSVASMLEDWR
ncbi:MAG: nitroreductase [Spirochaetae bacterium HGW-Spirochaetae-9]|nr:MAG: nitroreductase [Spirochaetae bacterium HGW-Spirochaetae-9]